MRKLTKFFVPMLLAILVLLPVTQADQVAAASKFEDGEYNLSLQVLHETGDKESQAGDYLSKDATLVVKDGENTVNISISQEADMVQGATLNGIKGEKNGSTITFSDVDISEKTNGTIHVVVPKEVLPPVGYDTDHTVIYQFTNLSDVPTTQEEAEEVEESDDIVEGKETPEDNPKTGDKTPILLFSVVLIASGVVLVRKVAFK